MIVIPLIAGGIIAKMLNDSKGNKDSAYSAAFPAEYVGMSDVPDSFKPLFKNVSRQHGIPVGFLVEIARRESKFNPNAVGSYGEVGMMQMMPGTAAEVGAVTADLLDPGASIEYAAQYIDKIRRNAEIGNDWAIVAMAYNRGPGYWIPGSPAYGKTVPISAVMYAQGVYGQNFERAGYFNVG